MDPTMMMIAPLVGGVILYGLMKAGVKSEGNALAQKFGKLGNLQGKSRAEILAAVGPPSSQSTVAGGKTVIQWIKPGYHIALIFEGDNCLGVSHEKRT